MSFFRSTYTLSLGSIIAQGLSFLLAMLIARMYSADAVAMYFEYITWASAIGGFLAMRMDIAAVNAVNKLDINRLIFLAFIFSVVITAIISLGYLLTSSVGIISEGSNMRLAYLSILGAACVSHITTFQNFLVAHLRFSTVVFFQVVVVTVTSFFIILLAYQKWMLPASDLNLALIAFLGHLIISIGCILYFHRNSKKLGEILSVKRDLTLVIKNYKEHLCLGAPMAVLNSIQSNMATIYLIKVMPTDWVIYFYVLQKIVVSPVSVLSNAIISTTMRMVSINKSNIKKIRSEFWIILMSLCAISFSLYVGIYIFSEQISKLFDLKSDRNFRDLSLILAGPLLLKFIASTLSGYIPALGQLRYEGYFKFPAFVIAIGFYVLGLGAYIDMNELEVFIFVESVLALFYILVIVKAVYKFGVN